MFLDFKKWVKSIQTAGYNGARTVDSLASSLFDWDKNTIQEISSISFLVNRWWTKRAKVWILSAKPVNKWGKNVQLVRVSFVPK